MRSTRVVAAVAFLICASTLWVYAPLRNHEFLDYDDPRYVSENPNFRQGLSWAGVAKDFRDPYFGNWIPLTHLSLRVDHALYGFEPAGYLITNVALHILTSLMLFFALLRMTGAVGRCAFIAAVFSLHPLHVESVAWVSERKDVLSGFFAMATLYAYARYAEGPPTFSRFLPVTITALLGLLSKSMLVTLPFVLLLLDVWPLRRIAIAPFEGAALRRALVEKLPIFALVIGVSVVTYSVQSDSGAVYPVSHLPVSARLMNAVTSYGVYLGQALWPSGLAAFYPHPTILTSAGRAAASVALLAALTFAVLWNLRSRPFLAVGWCLFLGMLVPVIGVVQVGMQAHADRYMYLPLLGPTLALAFGAVDLVGNRPRARAILGAMALVVIFALAAVTTRQIPHWKDSLALHTRIVEVNPQSYRSINHLGKALSRLGRYEEAKELFIAAMQLAPGWAAPRIGLGGVYYHEGDFPKAIAYNELAVGLDPNSAIAHANLGASLLEVKRYADARVHFQRAIELESDVIALLPIDAMPHFGLGEVALAEGDAARATRHFEDGLRLDPSNAGALGKLGALYVAAGRFDESRPLLERARDLGLNTAALYTAFAQLAVHQRDYVGARDGFRIALTIDPDQREAARRLTRLLATCEDPSVRNPAEAIRVGERASLRANGNDLELLEALAAAYAANGVEQPESAGAEAR